MLVGIIGISYKTADLSLREIVARRTAFLLEELAFPAVILSTCNRMEIYYSGSDLSKIHTDLLAILKGEIQEAFEHKLYSYFGYNCFSHLCRVTAGIDSAIFGETEIQKQVKNAYQKACGKMDLPSCLHYLFQKSLKIGKLLRSTLIFSRGMPSINEIIWETARLFFKEPKSCSILFVGFSQINRQIFSYFHHKGCKKMTLSSRQASAWEYTQEHESSFLPWNQLGSFSEYDIVITASHAEEYIITRNSKYQKENGQILIFDLSVPRNVHPDVGLSPFVNLFNIERLDALVEKKKEQYLHEIARSEKVMQENVRRLMSIYLEKSRKKEHQQFCRIPLPIYQYLN